MKESVNDRDPNYKTSDISGRKRKPNWEITSNAKTGDK